MRGCYCFVFDRGFCMGIRKGVVLIVDSLYTAFSDFVISRFWWACV